jgi:hypothetical protein
MRWTCGLVEVSNSIERLLFDVFSKNPSHGARYLLHVWMLLIHDAEKMFTIKMLYIQPYE